VNPNRRSIFLRNGVVATALVGAAFIAGPAAAAEQGAAVDASTSRVARATGEVPQTLPDVRALISSEAGCVANAEYMARHLQWSPNNPRVSQTTVVRVIARIKRVSAPCNDLLFRNGNRVHPDAGILTGNGFSFKAATCTGAEACDGGNGGLLMGSGGNGANGGDGGDAGWYSGRAGNGGDAVLASQDGGDGGRAGRVGAGGNGGAGLVGGDGGDGGAGGLLTGNGGNGGNGGSATTAGQAGGDGGAGGRAAAKKGVGGRGGAGGVGAAGVAGATGVTGTGVGVAGGTGGNGGSGGSGGRSGGARDATHTLRA